ncbi:MAG: mraZ protein [Candidatus Doudnabacteria bacterium Gr01-1014_77]|uniref:Transcriptional regulator MraZ n=1 Tax=Candidatus Doudnabacteria bacterium Gr01-1014_77 TaxID=2017133 RepID=A0A554J9W6_9BACT|nr:MAG: mraZ protein [Candidatus Doudnabacteria bacterium Gr01-1014_77]
MGISGALSTDCIPPVFIINNPEQMFIGEYTLSIDEKGRLSIPVKFRNDLKGKAVVTRGLDSSLFLYSQNEWLKLAEKLAALPISKANTRAFSRLMLAGAMDCEIDKAGRINIPDYLREFAKINKKVVVAGLYNRIEIWSEQAWTKYKKATEKDSNDIAEQLGEIGV